MYTQPGVLEVTGESHCASGKLIVARIGRTGGCGRPLGEHVVEWKLLRVCFADRHESRAKEK